MNESSMYFVISERELAHYNDKKGIGQKVKKRKTE